MANITLRQLRYFKAVAQHGHFGQAAEASAVSQPALSVQIKELEERLGCTLFEREPRAVRLTGLGAELLERAEDILQSVAELENLARAARGHLSGALRIGVIPTIAPYLLPGLLGDLARSHPELDIRMRETMTSTLLGELGQGRLDLAILALPVSEPNLEEADLFDERFVLIRPEAEDGLPVPDPASLSERRLLLLEEGHCFRDQALSFCGLSPATGKRQKTLDGSSLTTLVRMVEAGFGVTLIPEMAVEAETRAARVSVARFQGPAPARRVGMVWRKTDPMRGHYRELADQIRGASPVGGNDMA